MKKVFILFNFIGLIICSCFLSSCEGIINNKNEVNAEHFYERFKEELNKTEVFNNNNSSFAFSMKVRDKRVFDNDETRNVKTTRSGGFDSINQTIFLKENYLSKENNSSKAQDTYDPNYSMEVQTQNEIINNDLLTVEYYKKILSSGLIYKKWDALFDGWNHDELRPISFDEVLQGTKIGYSFGAINVGIGGCYHLIKNLFAKNFDEWNNILQTEYNGFNISFYNHKNSFAIKIKWNASEFKSGNEANQIKIADNKISFKTTFSSTSGDMFHKTKWAVNSSGELKIESFIKKRVIFADYEHLPENEWVLE